jgi:hypothetical protein
MVKQGKGSGGPPPQMTGNYGTTGKSGGAGKVVTRKVGKSGGKGK